MKNLETVVEKKQTYWIRLQSLTADIGAIEIHTEEVWLSFAFECTNVAFINISAFACGVTSDVAIYATAFKCSKYIVEMNPVPLYKSKYIRLCHNKRLHPSQNQACKCNQNFQ